MPIIPHQNNKNPHYSSACGCTVVFRTSSYIIYRTTINNTFAYLYTKLAASAREEVDDGDSTLASTLALSSSPAAPLPEVSLLTRLRHESTPTPPLPNRPTLPQRPVFPPVSRSTVPGERELLGSGEPVARRWTIVSTASKRSSKSSGRASRDIA